MLTVSQLAKSCGVSRATVLYYERIGLLLPKSRSDNGYRWYSDVERQRLAEIVRFRAFGVAVADLAKLLDAKNDNTQAALLSAQFNNLEQQIVELRKQQAAIVELLQLPIQEEQKMVTKARWVEIMQASGFSEEDMISWHRNFEKMEPAEHHKFLQSLGIEPSEIERIRRF